MCGGRFAPRTSNLSILSPYPLLLISRSIYVFNYSSFETCAPESNSELIVLTDGQTVICRELRPKGVDGGRAREDVEVVLGNVVRPPSFVLNDKYRKYQLNSEQGFGAVAVWSGLLCWSRSLYWWKVRAGASISVRSEPQPELAKVGAGAQTRTLRVSRLFLGKQQLMSKDYDTPWIQSIMLSKQVLNHLGRNIKNTNS